jgi:hypothetical protein
MEHTQYRTNVLVNPGGALGGVAHLAQLQGSPGRVPKKSSDNGLLHALVNGGYYQDGYASIN